MTFVLLNGVWLEAVSLLWHTPEKNTLETFIYSPDRVTRAPHYEDTGERFLPESRVALESPVGLFLGTLFFMELILFLFQAASEHANRPNYLGPSSIAQSTLYHMCFRFCFDFLTNETQF